MPIFDNRVEVTANFPSVFEGMVGELEGTVHPKVAGTVQPVKLPLQKVP